MSALACALLLAAQQPQAPAAPGYSPKIEPASDEPEAAMRTFALAEGFQVECLAAEPQLAHPVCFWIARGGEIYVAETFRHHAGVTDIREHMDWLDDDVAARTVEDRVAMYQKHLGDAFATYTTEHERIRILRDTDGDGKMDWDRVFSDGFHEAADGIAAGLLERDGNIYYACIPDLWLLRDEDGDGAADVRRKLSTGWGVRVALLGHDMHGFQVGPDGRLYWSIGDRGFRATTLDGTVLDHPFTGAVLRSDLDGSNVEIFATGLRNPQELAFDDRGELWTGDNNSDGGDQARWVLVVEQGDSGWRQAYQWLVEPNLRGPWNDEKLWVPHFAGQAAYVAPPVANVANGPSGLAFYPGTGMPERYAGHFFLCNFSGAPEWSGVYAFTVAEQGSGFSVGPVERFVWRPLATDCDFGWDGGLVVSDWVAGWNRTGKGRLWRVFEPESAADPRVAEVKALIRAGLHGRPVDELRSLLGHADRRVRQEAHLALAEHGTDGLRALERTARDPASARLARLHAIWGLGIQSGRQAGAGNAALLALLGDADADVRGQAARTLGDWNVAAAGPALLPLLTDSSARVRRLAATALARSRPAGAADAIVTLLVESGESDPLLRHAATYALWSCVDVARIRALAAHANVDVRVGAAVALRRLKDREGLVTLLDDADPRVSIEAARAIYDLPLESAFAPLADKLAGVGQAPNALARRALHAAFRLGGARRAQALADLAADAGARENLRREALDLLARWEEPPGRDGFHGEWMPIARRDASFLPDTVRALHAAGLAGAPTDVARAWVRLAGRARATALAPELTSIAADGARDPKLRTEALRALETLQPADWTATLRSLLFDAAQDVRATALELFQVAAPQEAVPLLEAALTASLAERRVAYAGLARLKDERGDALLARDLARLDAGFVPAEVALDLVLAAEKRDVPTITEALAVRQARRAGDPELAPWIDALYGGDAERGREIFRGKSELECLRCHAVAGEGGVVGPALDGIGARRSRLELAEALAAPNRVLAPGYEGTVVFLAAGTPVEGNVIEDTPEKLVLRKADGTVEEIARADIEGTKPGLSAMPANLVEHLSRAEMRDLIEYLSTLKEERKP